LATTATIFVHVPAGMTVVWTNIPMRVDGGTAVWHGELGTRLELEMRFQKSFFPRVWTHIWSIVTKPFARLRSN
jgi:hypothetical protein